MRHDKRFENLATLDNYELEHSSQDIRGYPLVGKDGQRHGIIKDLLVDENASRVAAIRLDNGKVCAVEPLEIHDNAVVYGAAAESFAEQGGKDVEPLGATGRMTGGDIEEERIPVVEEQLVIGKRLAEHGRDISVRTRVASDTVAEDVTLRDERVTVSHNPINRELSSTEAESLLTEGRTVSMTERDEEVVVGKKAVVTDEIVVKKEVGERTEHVEETVRRTEVDIDGDGAMDRDRTDRDRR